MNSSEAEEAWQQEKEFLDYMFVSLRHGDENGAAAAAASSDSGRIRRTGQQQQQQQQQQLPSSISYTTNSASANSAANNTDVSSTRSLTSVKTETPAGLDHLDNLCKLMEQLGELRDANSRLQKRVHYLEDMKTLQEMHQELDLFVGSDSAASASNMSTKADAGADRSLDSLDSGEILPIISGHQAELIQQAAEPAGKSGTTGITDNNSNSGSVEVHSSSGGGHRQSRAGKKIKSHHHMKFKKPGTLLKYRERSKSVGFDENVATPPITAGGEENEVDYDVNNASATTTPSPDSYKIPETSSSMAPGNRSRPKTKVSKWTRVKEAFRWEKAHVDQHQAASGSPSAGKVTSSSTSKLPDKEEVALDSSSNNRHQVSPYQHSLASESSSHAMARSPSPIFRLGRRRRSTTSSTSSSSLSECPLESEILKSFADAQELPLFHLEKRASSPEVNKLLTEGSEEESGGLLGSDVHQRGYVLSLPQMKRLHRQSTVSCDGNFATGLTPSGGAAHMPIPESQILCSEMPPPPDPIRMKGPESPNRRKTSSKNGSSLMEHQQSELGQQHPATIQQQAENSSNPDESVGSFISSLRSQLKPINEWTSKWHCDLMKNSPSALASSTSPGGGGGAVSHVETSSRNSLSVPSTPNQHQTFTFDEFPDGGLSDLGTASRENSPGGKKNHDIETSIKNHPGLLLNSISPEFRKKVEVWERLKSGLSLAPAFDSGALALATPPTPTTPQQHGSKKSAADSPDWNDIGKRRGEPDKLPPAFKKKLAEWEIRKAVAGKSDQNVEELHKILPHDFNRKLQEWERMKQQQAAAGKMSAVAGNQPGLERQGSGKQHHHSRGGKHVKTAQKTDEVQQHHRGEKQKEKELQWLEKELQKIEREKLRLEREREKYIERESRLEKIREAMKQPGHGPQREICIRTSTGEFRFQGLSRKFTKKLFQWEEQKGIRPEASTIALLDGAFSPGHHHHLHHHHPAVGEFSSSISARPSNLSAISRSKSESSIADLVSASVHSQPSSLSLNDAETTADFDRRLASDQEEGAQSTPGPGALLVEVEDVTEDCAAVVDIPEVEPQAPIYSISPAELRQTIHRSEQEEQPRFQVGITGPARVERNDSVRTEASFKLLEENLSLLDRLRAKGEIVKYLELQMTSIDGDMAGVANTQTEEMVRLKEEETCLSDQEDNNSTAGNSSTIDRLKRRIVLLESRGQQLKSEKEHLQTVYQRQCSQQVHLVQHLVDKMQQLRGIGTSSGDTTPPFDPEALQRLDTLTTEILQEAQTLENSMRHPQRLPAATGNQGELVRQPSSAVRFPEQLSIKANQLKEEYERLRSFDSDLETNSDDEPELTPTPRVILPHLPPVPSEMSSAARKKVFVETHRLVFAPLESSDDKASTTVYQPVLAEEGAEDSVPWRRDRPRDQPVDSWRRNSSTSTPTEENQPDQSRPTAVTTVRNTAPNIRRMIDKYHQRVTASGKERSAPTFQFRPRCDLMTDERSSSSTPPPTIVIEHRGQSSPLAAAADSPLPFEHGGHLHPNCLVHLSKSLSAGAMGPASTETQRAGSSSASSATGWKGSGVLRSQSGLQLPTGQVTPCARNPSFFRKSPLDPSIDDLLQKYRGRRQVGSVPADLPKSPTTNPERMLKLKQAREAFLTVGPGAIQSVESLCPSEDRAQPLVEEESQSSPQGPAFIVQDVTFEAQQPQAGDTGSCRSQEGSVVMAGAWSAGTGSSVPSSPANSRRSSANENLRSRTSPQQHPAVSRRSWLKQPSKFFFPKAPKTP